MLLRQGRVVPQVQADKIHPKRVMRMKILGWLSTSKGRMNLGLSSKLKKKIIRRRWQRRAGRNSKLMNFLEIQRKRSDISLMSCLERTFRRALHSY